MFIIIVICPSISIIYILCCIKRVAPKGLVQGLVRGACAGGLCGIRGACAGLVRRPLPAVQFEVSMFIKS